MRALVLVLLAACGASKATPDAPADGSSEVTGAVMVYAPYRAAGIITPGATVLGFDAAGRLVDRQTTNADGWATAQVSSGGFVVTVAPPGSASHDYYEWIDVAIGDHLATEAARVPEPTSRDVTVTLGRDGSDATSYLITGTSFAAESNAPAATGPITLAGTIWSDAPASEDLVAEATHGDHSRFAIAHAVPLDSPSIDLPAPAWMPAVTVDRMFTGLPTGTTFFTASEERLVNGLELWHHGDGAVWSSTSFEEHVDTPGNVGDTSGLIAEVDTSGPHGFGLGYNAPPTAIDLSMLAPTAFEVTRAVDDSVSWQQAGQGTATGVELVIAGSVSSWHVVMPPAQRAFQLPVLPADLQDDQSMPDVTVTYIGGNDPGGYAATRTDPNVFDLLRFSEIVPATSGTYRFAAH